ncbi:NAD(P)/FAD-dependent oxidoreductase [Polystyrenella longa]|nr:NAD(P)/FAD-dependent oxidoreductase [Polystyrenella longa]
MQTPHRVVVVGGGFGGLFAARSLKKVYVDVTLIDRRNFHLFQPLLYQVATGALSPANIAAPLRSILERQKNTRIILDEVVDFDVESREVITAEGRVPYDTLIVAAGSQQSYFGQDHWEEFAPGLKSIEDATSIRHRILYAFEAAEKEPDPVKREAWLTFVVVGAGPTGCEMAGAIAEIAHHTLKQEFRTINPADAKLIIVEAAADPLSMYPADLIAKARKSLEKRDIQVRTNTKVVDVEHDYVEVQPVDGSADPERIDCHTVIWAAGVKASPLGEMLSIQTAVPLTRGGKVEVQQDLTIPGHPEIFVVGDMAQVLNRDGKPLPGLAPVAMQQGNYVANVIRNRVNEKPVPAPFTYKDRGSMATIGRASAIAQIGRWKLSGFFAWILWLFVHIMQIVQFENRLLVLVQWSWHYLTFNRSARLITGTEEQHEKKLEEELVGRH